MGRILPFYRTGASLSGGGGGGLLGDATMWGQVFDWTALGTIAGPLRTGDFAVVNTLGPSGSFGVALYNGTDWQLYQSVFATVADLNAFGSGGELIFFGSISVVGTGSDTDPAYIYNGSMWVRTASVSSGYAWVISSLTDFLAVGLQDGDYGIYTPPGGAPIVLRYVSACAIAAGAGGGTRPMWVPPEAYAGTGLQIDCFCIGNEPKTSLPGQGLAVTEINTATIGSAANFMRLDAPSTFFGSSIARLTAPTITGDTKWWLTCNIAGNGTGLWEGGLFQNSAEDTQYVWGQREAANSYVQPFLWNAGWTPTTTALNLQAGGRAFPSTSGAWLVQTLAAGDMSDQILTTINGRLYSQYRRDADGASGSSNYTMTPQAIGGMGGVSSQIHLRNFFRLTWT